MPCTSLEIGFLGLFAFDRHFTPVIYEERRRWLAIIFVLCFSRLKSVKWLKWFVALSVEWLISNSSNRLPPLRVSIFVHFPSCPTIRQERPVPRRYDDRIEKISDRVFPSPTSADLFCPPQRTKRAPRPPQRIYRLRRQRENSRVDYEQDRQKRSTYHGSTKSREASSIVSVQKT